MDARALRGVRLRAAIVDEVLVAVAALLVFGMAVGSGAAALLALAAARLPGPLAPGRDRVVVVLLVATWVGARLLYGVLGEGGPAGATPGKRLVGLCVRGRAGEPPGYRRAFVRHVAKTFTIVSVVGLVAAAAGYAWHDAAAGTGVRASPRVPGDPRFR